MSHPPHQVRPRVWPGACARAACGWIKLHLVGTWALFPASRPATQGYGAPASVPVGVGPSRDHNEQLRRLWNEMREEIYFTEADTAQFKSQTLPLARIKKVGPVHRARGLSSWGGGWVGGGWGLALHLDPRPPCTCPTFPLHLPHARS